MYTDLPITIIKITIITKKSMKNNIKLSEPKSITMEMYRRPENN